MLLAAGVASAQIGPSGGGSTGSGTGPQGPAGNSVLNGVGAPASAVGNNGDFYLRTDTTCLYGPKASGAWPGSCTSLIGPSGSGGGFSGLTPGAIVTAATASTIGTPSGASVDASGNITANSITSSSAGTGNLTVQFGAAPANPASGNALIYADSTTGTLTCHTSTGASCMPSSVPATVVQTSQSNAYTTGTQDFTSSSHLIAKNGTSASKPATCTTGEIYFATDATPGQNWYFCTAANTWSQQASGGSGGAATSLVDGAANNALTVTQGTGTITNFLNVTDAPTLTNPQLTAAGSDTNINLQLTPKGSGSVYIPGTGMTTGANAPALLDIGASGNSGGSSFGVMEVLNLPSAFNIAEHLRWASNGTWQGSITPSGIYMNGNASLNISASNSGSTGRAVISNVAAFLGYAPGYFGLCSGASSATGCDVGLGRTSAGQFEINSGSAGGAVAANMRDLKLRHTLASGAAPSLTTGTGAVAGGDESGRVTLSAASQTSVVLTFGTAYTNPPACVANDESTLTLVQAVASTTTLTLNGSFGSADKITWRCGSY